MTAACVEHCEGIASENIVHQKRCSGFCRLGHDTRHFNVGQYRRVQRGTDVVQDASFFDPSNEVNQKDPSTTFHLHTRKFLGIVCPVPGSCDVMHFAGWAQSTA